MNRNALHGAPQHTFGRQDARIQSNFAVQPAAAPVKVNFKKSAVRVVRPAGTPAAVPATVPTPAPVLAINADPPAQKPEV